MRSKYVLPFLLLGAGWCALAVSRGGWWWFALWPGASFLLVCLAYAKLGPRVFGKRPDGRIMPLAVFALLPFLLFTWGVWHLARLLSREPAAHEVAPGVWVGCRAPPKHLPPGTTLVVDLTCEFPAYARARMSGDGNSGPGYLCVPTLDGSAPADAAFAEVLERIAGSPAGPVFIHCAQGRGRSVAVAAAVLIARGLARDVEEAERLVARSRPSVRLNEPQREWVRRVTAHVPAPAS